MNGWEWKAKRSPRGPLLFPRANSSSRAGAHDFLCVKIIPGSILSQRTMTTNKKIIDEILGNSENKNTRINSFYEEIIWSEDCRYLFTIFRQILFTKSFITICKIDLFKSFRPSRLSSSPRSSPLSPQIRETPSMAAATAAAAIRHIPDYCKLIMIIYLTIFYGVFTFILGFFLLRRWSFHFLFSRFYFILYIYENSRGSSSNIL